MRTGFGVGERSRRFRRADAGETDRDRLPPPRSFDLSGDDRFRDDAFSSSPAPRLETAAAFVRSLERAVRSERSLLESLAESPPPPPVLTFVATAALLLRLRDLVLLRFVVRRSLPLLDDDDEDDDEDELDDELDRDPDERDDELLSDEL